MFLPPCPSSSWLQSTASALLNVGWGRTGSRCCACRPSYASRTPSGSSAGRPVKPMTRNAKAWRCPPTEKQQNANQTKKNLYNTFCSNFRVQIESGHLDVLLLGGDNPLPHEQTVIFKERVVFLRLLLALVQQEADDSLLQNIPKLPAEAAGEQSAPESQL